MNNVALWVKLEAKPGKEKAVEQFLKNSLMTVEREPATLNWYALRISLNTFGIFDTFADENGRQAHLAGEVAKMLMQKAPELFSKPPSIEKLDVLASKVHEMEHTH